MTKTLIKSRYKNKIKILPKPVIDDKTLLPNLQLFKDKLVIMEMDFLSINEHRRFSINR